MPKRDMQDFWSLLGDLFRELSWINRIGFFGGMLVGLAYGGYLVSHIPSAEIRRGFLRILILFLMGISALGAVLGLALGAVVELTVKKLGSKGDPPSRRRR